MSRLDRLVTTLRKRVAQLPQGDGLSFSVQCLVFAACLVCFFSRWPQLFLNAQFYAEDGKLWYVDAYQTGWIHSLTLPYAGYLNTLQRLGTGPALLVPFRDAPTVNAIVGLLFQASVIPVLLSARCRDWAPLSSRIVFVMLYVALPNAREIFIDLGNSQWHFALLAVLLAFGNPPRSHLGKVVEGCLFFVAGFCGPFCILLLPVVLVYWWIRRRSWTLWIAAAMSIGSTTQLYLLIHTHGARVQDPLGAGLVPLLRIFGAQVVLNAMLGGHSITGRLPMVVILLAVCVGVIIYWTIARSASLPMKLLLAYSCLLFAASLRTPEIAGNKPLWWLLTQAGDSRYWFFPVLSFLWGAVWCLLYVPSKPVSRLAACILCLSVVGITYDWEYKPFEDQHFSVSASRFEAARPGEHLVIPITPHGWTMDILKK